jgi:hypothetical protein
MPDQNVANVLMEWMAMDVRYGRGFNAVAQEELWDRWRRGESLKAIGRAFGSPFCGA